MKEDRVVLGIDVGIAITGWAVVRLSNTQQTLLDYGAITTEPKDSMPLRLNKLHVGLMEVIKSYTPTEVAVEDLFYFKNKKTIISVGQARGVILLTGELNKIAICNYTPLQVKTAVCGYGRASKGQVQKMVTKIFRLKDVPKPDDCADAIAIAFCHISST